ncbi:MAG: hypothetical protein EP344_03125 [Bacteroidetes bacterium]|nr:MAG: hypothetical protein EP344_03125 [Bacteroidota bacterium]
MHFDPDKYKVYTWKHWMLLHWIINPGLAFNELVLGQRVPRVSLLDKTSEKPLIERTLIPCPHCEKLHDGRTWSTQNGTAFRNWFGLYCPACGGIIPCLTNGLSFILLALTAPLWYAFRDRLKARWLEKQPARYRDLDVASTPNPYEDLGWIRIGLGWGLFMYVFMTFILPFFYGEDLSWKQAVIGVPVWAIGGLSFGYAMKRLFGKKEKVRSPNTE